MNKDRFYLIGLFDIYKELLTKKQIAYFEDYYINDESLAELAQTYQVSRNAILDSINKTEKNLKEYESKLELFSQKKQILSLLENDEKDLKTKILELKLFK